MYAYLRVDILSKYSKTNLIKESKAVIDEHWLNGEISRSIFTDYYAHETRYQTVFAGNVKLNTEYQI